MARDFTSAANYLQIGDVAAIDITGTALTLSCWWYQDTAIAFAVLMNKGGTGAATQYTLGCNSNNIFASIGDGAGEDLVTGAAVSNTAWTHMGMVKNGTGASGIKTFVNGSPTSHTSNRSIQNSATGLRIGSTNAGSLACDGRIAEIGIWNASLTDDEMAALAKGFIPPMVRPQSLQLYMTLLQAASPEPDLRNSNDATLTGTLAKVDHPRIITPREALYVP